MTVNTKNFIKSTILGLLGGGTLSALYALNNKEKKNSTDQESRTNEITVPLSRRQFMKAVRPRGKSDKESSETASKKTEAKLSDISKLAPQELMSLKKSLLRSKTASAKCSRAKSITAPISTERKIKHVAGVESTFTRDGKGRFSVEKEKKAGIVDSISNGVSGALHGVFGDTLEDAGATIANNMGLVGGVTAGLVATKMVADRVMVNKKKRQVEAARKRYIDALANEVNDEDTPYYKKASSDTSALGSLLGMLGVAGIGAGTAAGVVMYRIMENRRKEAEKAKDKDLANYPSEKTIRFRFPEDNAPKNSFFV